MAEKEHVAVRLPPQAKRMLDDLIPLGIYGTTRAEIARTLILDQLKRLIAEKVLVSPGGAASNP